MPTSMWPSLKMVRQIDDLMYGQRFRSVRSLPDDFSYQSENKAYNEELSNLMTTNSVNYDRRMCGIIMNEASIFSSEEIPPSLIPLKITNIPGEDIINFRAFSFIQSSHGQFKEGSYLYNIGTICAHTHPKWKFDGEYRLDIEYKGPKIFALFCDNRYTSGAYTEVRFEIPFILQVSQMIEDTPPIIKAHVVGFFAGDFTQQMLSYLEQQYKAQYEKDKRDRTHIFVNDKPVGLISKNGDITIDPLFEMEFIKKEIIKFNAGKKRKKTKNAADESETLSSGGKKARRLSSDTF